MTAPKLTVGIPTFNRASWLSETIESVLGQTFVDFRLIVSDNASEDDTADVVRSFGDQRIHYERAERNVGATANLNRLLALTETEYVVLLPDDDVLYPGHLEASLSLLERVRSVGLVHSAFDFIDEQSTAIARRQTLASRSPVTIERRDRALERLMVSDVGLCFPSVTYRTKVITDAGGFRGEEEPFCDRQLWMRIALGWDFGYLRQPLAGFRLHPETLTTRVGTEQGVEPGLPARADLHSEINFHRRIDFLEGAPLPPSRASELRALATLQRLVDEAGRGLPSREVAGRLSELVRTCPRVVRRPAVWRLVLAQLGARRARSVLRDAIKRSDRVRLNRPAARKSAARHRVLRRRPRTRPVKVSFFGHFGSMNSGNESTLLAILARLRSLSPDGEFCCVCTNPETVAARDGIDAVEITTRVTRVWNRDLPLIARVPMAFVGVSAEIGQYVRAFKTLKGTDMLIVPGTGLVTDAYGLYHWGPYSLFKWVFTAKLRRSQVLFVSIGAGPIYYPRGRKLVKAALSLADYRSYRDDASRDCLREIGLQTAGDRVYPDLVFSLPKAMLPADEDRSVGGRRVVGLGLMAYAWNYGDADPDLQTFKTYLESLATFATWLLDHDYDIRLLTGDGDGDPAVVEEFKSVLRARSGSYDERRVISQQLASVQDLLAEIAKTDVVVATRFHNVLLTLLLNKPVIALSFHHKCSSLMHQMNLSEYCHELNRIDADRLIAQFQELETNDSAVKYTIRQGVDEARAALEEQYKLLFEAA